MPLTIVRLLAVYLGSAAAALWLASRFVRAISLPAAVFLTLAPLVLTGRALVTGGVYGPIDILYDGEPFAAHRAEAGIGPTQSPPLSDVVYQMIPWRRAVRDAVKNGRWPLWNPFDSTGTPLLGSQLAGVFYPGTWIGFLLPLPQAWTFDMALRFFLSIASAYLFFRDLGCGGLPAAIGAGGWGFCDFLVFLAGHPQSAAIGPFPLLLLALRRLARDADRNALLLAVAALLLILSAGHPESVLYTVAGGGLYFLFELSGTERRRVPRAVGLSLAAGALALGVAALSLLPFLEILPRTQELLDRTVGAMRVREWLPLRTSLRHAATFLMPYAYGVFGRGRVESFIARPDGAYAGAVLLPLAVTGLFGKRRERWLFLFFVAIGVALFVGLEPLTHALAALPLFSIALLHPFVFLAAFGLAALAALGAEEIRRGRRSEFVASALVLVPLLFLLLLRRRPWLLALGMPEPFLRELALAQLAPLLAAALLVATVPRRRAGLALAGLLGILLAGRSAEAGSVHPTYPARAFYPRLPFLDRVARDSPWRIAGASYTFVPNASAVYGLEDVRGYEMTTFAPLAETFPLWCVRQPVWFNRVDDPARPFLSFLNVRYAIVPRAWTPPAGWTPVDEDAGGRLFENPGALPRAFVPRRLHRESDPARQRERLFAISDFSRDGVLTASPSGLVENGEASVRVASYTPQRLELTIDARTRAWVATSLVGWPGWRLTLDGDERPLRDYNRAFLAFETPAGTHRALLRYRPESFEIGRWISAASLAILIAAATRKSRT